MKEKYLPRNDAQQQYSYAQFANLNLWVCMIYAQNLDSTDPGGA